MWGRLGGMAEHVDYRYILANERTFLAYVRTALSLQIAGLGVLQFLTQSSDAVRHALGVALVTVGSFVAVTGHLRYRRNERAIRAGTEMAASHGSRVITVVVVLLPLAAAVALALA
jgi:putative membrane protein